MEVLKQLADDRGRGPKRDEHGGKAQYEHEGIADGQHPHVALFLCGNLRFREILKGGPGDEGQVRGYEREHAGGQE